MAPLPPRSPAPTRAFLGLGSNQGDREEHLRTAVGFLGGVDGIEVVAASPVYRSAAHVLPGQAPGPDFLNAAVEIRTTLAPDALFRACKQAERRAGRSPDARRWAPRPLDVDVLLYGGRPVATDVLTIPHPRLAERRFVLRPLLDLDAALAVPTADDHPDSAVPVRDLLDQTPDAGALHLTKVDLNRPAPGSAAVAWPDRLRYVAIEGVIGAGKTTLARMLAERVGARLVLEEFEENPFLPRFYEDAERWAFQTQLAFLASRFRQQQALAAGDLFHQTTVADYTFDKDRLFAQLTLTGDEMRLYDQLFAAMAPNAPVPDLTVYLQSTVERLVQNVAQRGRSYEQDIDPQYLADLSGAYDEHFFHRARGPVLILHVADLDFVQHPEHFDELVRQIATVRGPGVTYFNPPRDLWAA
jgi:2-amino-4-hydroxy-6-hydroxymethyldihydropteridine diphosphokinase